MGDGLGLDFLQFDVADKAALVDKARQLAFQQAQQKAQQLAELTGQSIGGIAAVSESQGYVRLREMFAKAASSAAASPRTWASAPVSRPSTSPSRSAGTGREFLVSKSDKRPRCRLVGHSAPMYAPAPLNVS